MSLERNVHHSRASCVIRNRHFWIFHLSKFPPQLPFLLLQSCDDKPIPPNPRTEGLFGRVAVQSPLTCCELNAIVEISSAEDTHFHHASRWTSCSSSYNSSEDATSATVSSEINERQKHRKAGFTAAHAKERSKCNPCDNLSLYTRKFYVTLITHSKHGERLVAIHSHQRKSSRDIRGVQENTSQIKRFEPNNKK